MTGKIKRAKNIKEGLKTGWIDNLKLCRSDKERGIDREREIEGGGREAEEERERRQRKR